MYNWNATGRMPEPPVEGANHYPEFNIFQFNDIVDEKISCKFRIF